MKLLDKIKAIQTNPDLNTRQKWREILDINPTGRPGAEQVRQLQSDIRTKWRVINRRVNPPKQPSSYVPPAERRARRERREIENQRQASLLMRDAQDGYPRTLLNLSLDSKTKRCSIEGPRPERSSRQCVKVGDWIITTEEAVSYDNNYYSKSWHRKYGGKKVVECRKVIIRRFKNGQVEDRSIEVSSWRGSAVLKPLAQAGIIAPVKVPRHLKPVQLNKYYDVELIKNRHGIALYRRTLLGETVDYCAVARDTTFHAESIPDALSGLFSKLRKNIKRMNSPINYKLCKELGFCDTGIESFCDDFDIDIKGDYSPREIEALIAQDLEKARPYEQELRKVAETVGYTPTI